MSVADLHSDAFQQLLADALRAGPGSPEWHQAVQILRDGGATAEADEYRLLITAREHLESGREYRSVRAGPAFTRKVLDAVEQTAPDAPCSPATWIALAATLALAVVVVLIIYHARPAAPGTDDAAALARTYFVQPLISAEFRDEIPSDWRIIGAQGVVPSPRGLRPRTGEGRSDEYEGGGIVTVQPLPAGRPFALEAHLLGRITEEIVPQVFVTDSPDFSPERGTAGRELTWMLNSARPVVALPDGQFAGSGDRLVVLGESYTIRILLNERHAIVECGGQRLWSGEHQLDAAKPRYAGVRFLRKGPRKNDYMIFSQVRILLPPGQ